MIFPRLVDLWMEMMRRHHEFETAHGPSAHRRHRLIKAICNCICEIRNPIVILAEDGKEIGAYCCAYVCQNLPMFIPSRNLVIFPTSAVTPSWQRRGVGTQLLEYTKKWFRACGIKSLQLQFYSNNSLGREFWKSKGFASFVERDWLDL